MRAALRRDCEPLTNLLEEMPFQPLERPEIAEEWSLDHIVAATRAKGGGVM
jgi:hypothetical protein